MQVTQKARAMQFEMCGNHQQKADHCNSGKCVEIMQQSLFHH
jgi:hypothetical protein